MTEPMRWRMIAYLTALFVAGAITGAAVMARVQADSQTLKVGRSEEIAAMMEQRLLPLHLTPEQRQKLAPLIKQTSEQLEASHLQCLQRSSTAVESLYAEIKTILTPDQLASFNHLETERRDMLRKKYNYPPPGMVSSQP